MACLISTNDVTVEYPTKRVLGGISLGVNEGDRIGIVGGNGDGKTTLLRVLSGHLVPDDGSVVRNGSPTVGLLQQSNELTPELSVGQVVEEAAELRWESDRRNREIVDSLLSGIDFDSKIGALSGGQKRKVDLARLLIGSWDVLMLDEPTNHLDITAIDWLAKHLGKRWAKGSGSLLVVTHDRWFLDEVCTSMWEVHDGRVSPFEGGYSAYVMQRVERDRIEAKARAKRANQLRKELAWLSRGAQARRSKPKFHIEKAEELIANEPPVRNGIELKRAAMSRLGKQVLEMEDASVSIEGKTILDGLNWIIGPGDRIGIIGENGAGKTTLLRLLQGTIQPSSGSLKTGKTVRMAALTQELEELRPVEDDPVRVVLSRCKTSYAIDGKEMSPAALLERVGFAGSDLNARCKDLSGGQRRRLQLVLTLLDEPNVLLLDEPGNDLDTDMMAAVEDLLDSWPGTLLVVSHDRYLLERVTDELYALVDGRIRHLPGGVDEYLHIAAESSGKAKNASNSQQESGCGSKKKDESAGNPNKHNLRKQAASLERKMSTQRSRIASAREAFESCDPYDYESLVAAQERLDEEKKRLEALEDEWLEVSIALQ